MWVPTGCNTRFRLSKYYPGERFAAHHALMVSFSPRRGTFITLNIYLNDLDPEQYGRTLFYAAAESTTPVDSAGGVAGSLAFFRQPCVRHEGEPLASGLKYLLRADVVYEKCDDDRVGLAMSGTDVQPVPLFDDAAGPHQAASASAQTDCTRRVQFASCTVHTFDCGLDLTKLPSDGDAPLGLGQLLATTTVALEAWEP